MSGGDHSQSTFNSNTFIFRRPSTGLSKRKISFKADSGYVGGKGSRHGSLSLQSLATSLTDMVGLGGEHDDSGVASLKYDPKSSNYLLIVFRSGKRHVRLCAFENPDFIVQA
jgi:hypothetical protein